MSLIQGMSHGAVDLEFSVQRSTMYIKDSVFKEKHTYIMVVY